jgi:hypothetical protein
MSILQILRYLNEGRCTKRRAYVTRGLPGGFLVHSPPSERCKICKNRKIILYILPLAFETPDIILHTPDLRCKLV